MIRETVHNNVNCYIVADEICKKWGFKLAKQLAGPLRKFMLLFIRVTYCRKTILSKLQQVRYCTWSLRGSACLCISEMALGKLPGSNDFPRLWRGWCCCWLCLLSLPLHNVWLSSVRHLLPCL